MIRFYNVVLRENDIGSPFVPKEKKWVAAAIAAGAGLLGAALGASSNADTNEANMEMNEANIDQQKRNNALNAKLQRETNEQNYKIFQEQNAFNLDMWNKQNEYNDPQNQVARLLAAGINPSTGFGKASEASSLSSASGASMNAPHMEAPKNVFQMRPTDFSGISDSGIAAVNAYNSSRMMQAETKNKEALTANTAFDTSFKAKTMAENIRILQNEAKGSGWSAELAKRQLAFIDATQKYDIAMKYGDYQMQFKSFELMQKQIRNQELQNDILEITKAYSSKMNDAQIASLWSSVHQAQAEIGLINANRLLTDVQREHEIQKKVGTIIDNGMKGVDFQVKKAVKGYLIKDSENHSEMLDFERRNQKSGERFRRFQSLIPFTSPAARVMF